jgi:uncharacterized protein YjiS (DUF1127 family)
MGIDTLHCAAILPIVSIMRGSASATEGDMTINSTAYSSATTASAGVLAKAASWVVIGVGQLGMLVDHAIAAHERWCQRQALLRLDDHLLKDIGLTRADVEREVTKPVWRD